MSKLFTTRACVQPSDQEELSLVQSSMANHTHSPSRTLKRPSHETLFHDDGCIEKQTQEQKVLL
eukprot:4481689-Amphidinium_carterae.1